MLVPDGQRKWRVSVDQSGSFRRPKDSVEVEVEALLMVVEVVAVAISKRTKT